MNTKTSFSVPSPPQRRSQAVVCVSTPRMYPRSGYFLVNNKHTGPNKDILVGELAKIDKRIGTFIRNSRVLGQYISLGRF